MRLDLDLDRLVDEVATRVAAQLADRIASQAPSPWMAMEEAIAYTRIPAGTFRKWRSSSLSMCATSARRFSRADAEQHLPAGDQQLFAQLERFGEVRLRAGRLSDVHVARR